MRGGRSSTLELKNKEARSRGHVYQEEALTLVLAYVAEGSASHCFRASPHGIRHEYECPNHSVQEDTTIELHQGKEVERGAARNKTHSIAVDQKEYQTPSQNNAVLSTIFVSDQATHAQSNACNLS